MAGIKNKYIEIAFSLMVLFAYAGHKEATVLNDSFITSLKLLVVHLNLI